MIQPVVDLLRAYNAYSEPLIRDLKLYAYSKTFSPEFIVLREDEVCRHVFFIVKGLFRAYVLKGNKEVNIWYMLKNDLAAAASSFFLQLPSKEYIEAMEETEVVCLSYEHLILLCDKYPAFKSMVLSLSWKYYSLFYERVIDLLGSTKRERYRYLLEKQPELAQRVPAIQLNSYLGMSRASFNRVKEEIRSKK